MKLVGEYIVEILELIEQHLHRLDRRVYADFISENEKFYDATRSRVVSYWNCYYRQRPFRHYVGNRLIGFFDRTYSDRWGG